MTQITNAFDSFEAVGNREDLSDVIYDITPMDTPFTSGAPKTTATATKHEWQTDSLADASEANAQLEGDDIDPAASTATTRLNNYCQIAYKSFAITGTQEAVNKAGRSSEWAMQLMKRSKELKRDMEKINLYNNAAVAGNATTARELAGVPAWLATNVSKNGSTDPTGDGTDARSGAGTLRNFTESLLKDVLVSIWDEGGDPDCIMTSGTHKQEFSTFTGNATRFKTAEDSKLNATIELYASDFGDLEVFPNRFMTKINSGATAIDHTLVLQKDMWAVATLRAPFFERLAKIGDGERGFVLAEWTLEARNEAASGIVADLN